MVDTFLEWNDILQQQGKLISDQILNQLTIVDIGDQILFMDKKVKPFLLKLPAMDELTDYYNSEIKICKTGSG